MKKLLDFVVIGGMKCGSTAVGTYFSENPNVNFCDMIETDYFSHNYNKIDSIDNYFKTFFEEKIGLKGESSPTYSYPDNLPKTPLMLKNNFPEIKVILIVRNPIKRVESHINHLKLNGNVENLDVRECLDSYPGIIDKSRFGLMVDEYLKVFNKDNFFVVKFEEVISGEGLIKMCEYLKIKPHSNTLPKANKTDARYIEIPIIRFYKRNWIKFRNLPGFNKIRRPLKKMIDKLFSKKLTKSDLVTLSNDEIALIKSALHKDDQLFKKYYDFSLFDLKK